MDFWQNFKILNKNAFEAKVWKRRGGSIKMKKSVGISSLFLYFRNFKL